VYALRNESTARKYAERVAELLGQSPIEINDTSDLNQCFSTSGMHTTGGTRRVVWWYMRALDYHLFHNLFLKMLIALLKSF
jgi:hypothetical protein